MSMHKFDDECPLCRPVLLNPTTGQKYPDDDPMVVKLEKVWSETTLEERKSFHRFCCLSSKAVADVRVMEELARRLKED